MQTICIIWAYHSFPTSDINCFVLQHSGFATITWSQALNYLNLITLTTKMKLSTNKTSPSALYTAACPTRAALWVLQFDWLVASLLSCKYWKCYYHKTFYVFYIIYLQTELTITIMYLWKGSSWSVVIRVLV